jgi:two-component system OmpR family response regulator
MTAVTTAVRLLLVEDDPDASEVIARALQSHGFEVEACASAGAALVRIDLNPRPGAAIIDLGLPDGPGGIILWRLRRDFGDDMPVAVVTGKADPLTQPYVARGRPDVVFPKPVDLKALVAWVRSMT